MTKATGIVRTVDELGRISIPAKLRRTMDLLDKDSLDISIDGDKIVLKKYRPACVLCGGTEDLSTLHGKNMCQLCLTEITKESITYIHKTVSLK